jgi:hypothetical protein
LQPFLERCNLSDERPHIFVQGEQQEVQEPGGQGKWKKSVKERTHNTSDAQPSANECQRPPAATSRLGHSQSGDAQSTYPLSCISVQFAGAPAVQAPLWFQWHVFAIRRRDDESSLHWHCTTTKSMTLECVDAGDSHETQMRGAPVSSPLEPKH